MSETFTEYYRDFKQQKGTTVKGMLRDVALSGLAAISSEHALDKPRVHFIYIHHVFRDEEAALDGLLQRLSKQHTFISYTEAVNKVLSRKIDKPYVTFSSDDGLKNNLPAARILQKHGASACFFINPGIIGEKNYNNIKQHCTETLRAPVVAFLDWKEVNELQTMGHEIGGHTMMHMNIAEQSAEAVNTDLRMTMKVLREHCGEVVHFAFPYGRFFHFSSVGRKAVYDAGFTTCATAERGCHITDGTPIANTELCIRRDHIVLGWPMSHIMYFLINSAKKAAVSNNFYPPELI